MPSYLPEDMQVDQAAIDRQRALAQMLQQQGSQAPQGQMISGRYVGPSWTQYLANGLANYRGQSQQLEADKKQKALAEALQGRRDAWVNSMPQDKPAQTMDAGSIDPSLASVGNIETSPAQPVSPNDMLKWGMQGQRIDPQMAQLGMQLAQKDNTPIKVGKDEVLLDNKTKKPIFSNLVAPQGASTIQEYNLARQQGYPGTIQDFLLEQKKAGATKVSTETKISNFEPFNNKLQGGMAEKLVSNYENLQNLPATIQALDKAKNYAANSSFVGSGADTKLAMVKFMNNNLGTNIKESDVKNAEALRSALFYNVMDNLKKMDASPSQQQQQLLQDAMGRITTDPKALPEIIDFWKGQLQSKAAEHNRRVDETVAGGKVQFPYDIHVRVPASTATPIPGSSSNNPIQDAVEAELQRRGIK